LHGLEGAGLEDTWPEVLSDVHRLVAESAFLAGAYREVAPEAEASLSGILARCGPSHPRTHTALSRIDRLVTALLDHVARAPGDTAATSSLADLANRLAARLGPDHWLARGARVAAENARNFARVGSDGPRRLVEARAADLRARVLLRDGKFADAVTEASQAVASARSSGMEAPLEVADALTALGLAQAFQNDGVQAIAWDHLTAHHL